MTDPEPVYIPVVVTCRTADCANAGYALEIYVPPEPLPPNVVCGVCGQQITDIAAAT